MRARGLKHQWLKHGRAVAKVAPHAGAWIETGNSPYFVIDVESRPMRARGLKQMRLDRLWADSLVAPHAGAWIETRVSSKDIYTPRRRAPCGRVD